MKEKILHNKKNVSDYFNEYKLISKRIAAQKNNDLKKVKIALLSSSTIKGIERVLFVQCCNLGITPEIFIGGYKQYHQEILDDDSSFYKFKPDLVIINIDTRTLLGDNFFNYYQLSSAEKDNLYTNSLDDLLLLVDKIKHNIAAKIILHNFEVPTNSPLGIVESKQSFGLIEFVKKINFALEEKFKNDNQVFIFDYENFCSKLGKNNIFDYKMYYIGDIKTGLKYFPELCFEYVSYIKPLMSLTKKCIVLDLDNTLWGGIIGEDGLEGIKLGPSPDGRPFFEFQKYLLAMFNRGVILAINSKNNSEDALNAIRNHPYMILKEEHFASIKINWNDKISNMKEISKDINIGLDSLVFFDDDDFNREIVKTSLPEVEVVDLPKDPSLYLKTLAELNSFNSFYLSEEDRMRGAMYAGQRKREELSRSTTNVEEYLKALKIKVTIERVNSFNSSRISQLTQKTNQFNMTTRRYSEENIKQFSENSNSIVLSVRVEDKFGDNGITGAVIIEKKKKEWIIDSFLLSCRIIGRKIEDVILAYIAEEARKENVDSIIGVFIPTNKNNPAKEFYAKNNFKLIKEDNNCQFWKLFVDKKLEYPEFIDVLISG